MARTSTRDTGLRYGEGTIVERPYRDDVRYQARWVDAGRQRAQTFATHDAAEDYLRHVARAKRDGRYTAPLDLTVADAIADYLERGAARWSGGTLVTYRQRAAAHILPNLGSRRLHDLDTADVQRWVDGLTVAGLAPATIQPTVAVLAGALKEAVRLGWLARNVAQGVRLPTIRQPAMTVWSDTEARRVLRAARDQPRWRALYQLQLVAGLRPGEVRALQWTDIDLERAVFHVRRTMAKDSDGHWTVKAGTKRGNGRRIALPLPAVAALTAWRTAQGPATHVFGGAKPLANMTWVRAHRALCAHAKVPVITLHGLRHTAATLLLEHGIHPKIVADILGHAKIQITLDRYSHPSESLQRAAAESLAARLDDGVADDNTTAADA